MRDPTKIWRKRFYALASMTEYFVSEIATPSEGEDAFLLRVPFLVSWPTDTDIAQPLQ